MKNHYTSKFLVMLGLSICTATPFFAQTDAGAQMVSAEDAWTTNPIFTVGESIGSYLPLGILDGMGATPLENGNVRVYVNHEVTQGQGYSYTLANGTSLKGSRISFFDVNPESLIIEDAGLAFNTIFDRYGMEVTSAPQINEGTNATNGIDRLCSGGFFKAGEYGLVDDMYVTGEESSNGQLFALDVATGELHSAPWAGRAAWENVAFLDAGANYPNKVAMLIGDDTDPAPLYLYIGDKDYVGDGSFLDRNGLAHGQLFAFATYGVFDNPQQFNGTGNFKFGKFFPVAHYNAASAGMTGYDAQGFANQDTQYTNAWAIGAFSFSRPEDLSVNPIQGNVACFASTGRGSLYPADDWGVLYTVDIRFRKNFNLLTVLEILYDGNDAGDQFSHPDFGLRNPDNLTWAHDGHIYVQEDKSTQLNVFGGTSGEEASIWRIDASNGAAERIAQMDRGAELPAGQVDNSPLDLGNWESSGIIDVTDLFPTEEGHIKLLINTQAHSVTGGVITSGTLVQGGQILFLDGDISAPALESAQSNAAAATPAITLYPVPANEIVNVGFESAKDGYVTVTVIDLSGRTVLSSQFSVIEGLNQVTLNTESLSAGSYSLCLQTNDSVQRTSFIKK